MASRAGTDLTRYLGLSVIVETTLQQHWTGILRGFDEFMNCTMEDLQLLDDEKKPVGDKFPKGVIRGRAVVSLETQTQINAR